MLKKKNQSKLRSRSKKKKNQKSKRRQKRLTLMGRMVRDKVWNKSASRSVVRLTEGNLPFTIQLLFVSK